MVLIVRDMKVVPRPKARRKSPLVILMVWAEKLKVLISRSTTHLESFDLGEVNPSHDSLKLT